MELNHYTQYTLNETQNRSLLIDVCNVNATRRHNGKEPGFAGIKIIKYNYRSPDLLVL